MVSEFVIVLPFLPTECVGCHTGTVRYSMGVWGKGKGKGRKGRGKGRKGKKEEKKRKEQKETSTDSTGQYGGENLHLRSWADMRCDE